MLPAFRLIFNATALLGLLGLAALLGLGALQATDLPWGHLALGRLLSESGSLPVGEALLYGAPGAAFDARSWGWDWGAYQWARSFGPGSLRWLDALALLGSLAAVAAAGFRRGARPFSTAAFTAWAFLAARGDLAPGPGLVGFAAFCAALWMMEGELWPAFFNRWIWLAPLALVTVNLHPSAWALAPLVGLWLLTEEGGPAAERPPQPRLAKTLLFGVLLVCLCLHPQGLAGLLRAPRGLAPSPLLPGAFAARQSALLLVAAAGLLLVASSWTAEGRRHLGRDLWLSGIFGAAALLSRSALPFFLALAAPISAARFDILVDALPRPLRALRWPAKLAAVGALAAWAFSGGLRPLAFIAGGTGDAATKPAQTLAFYEAELLNANILCPPEWSGWLAWKLSPNARFAVDSAGSAGGGRGAAFAELLQAQGDWRSVLESSGTEAVWVPRGAPLALALTTAQAWQPVSFDNASVLYVRDLPQHKELIRVHAPRGLRPGDPQRPFDDSRLAQAEADLEARLTRDPGVGVLYLYLAELWLAKDQEPKARQTLEAGIRADAGFADNYARLAALRALRGDRAAARALYQRALRLQAQPAWAEALARLDAE